MKINKNRILKIFGLIILTRILGVEKWIIYHSENIYIHLK